MKNRNRDWDRGKIWIYALADPREPELYRYIGQSNAPRFRHLEHCQDASGSVKSEWLEHLRQFGILPQMVILQEVHGQIAADKAECEWIKKLRPQLTNGEHPRTRHRREMLALKGLRCRLLQDEIDFACFIDEASRWSVNDANGMSEAVKP